MAESEQSNEEPRGKAAMFEFEWMPICCHECGIYFAVPMDVFAVARRHGHDLSCPRGHDNSWESEEWEDRQHRLGADLTSARREIVELKEQLVDVRHRAEVAEAATACNRPRRRPHLSARQTNAADYQSPSA